jgi:hypothetical protein
MVLESFSKTIWVFELYLKPNRFWRRLPNQSKVWTQTTLKQTVFMLAWKPVQFWGQLEKPYWFPSQLLNYTGLQVKLKTKIFWGWLENQPFNLVLKPTWTPMWLSSWLENQCWFSSQTQNLKTVFELTWKLILGFESAGKPAYLRSSTLGSSEHSLPWVALGGSHPKQKILKSTTVLIGSYLSKLPSPPFVSLCSCILTHISLSLFCAVV